MQLILTVTPGSAPMSKIVSSGKSSGFHNFISLVNVDVGKTAQFAAILTDVTGRLSLLK